MLKFKKMMRSKLDLTKNGKEEKCRSAPDSPADSNAAQLLKFKGHQSSANHYTTVSKSTSLNRGLDNIHSSQFGDQQPYNREHSSVIQRHHHHHRKRQSKSVECILSADHHHHPADYPQQAARFGYESYHQQQPHSRSDKRSAPTPRRSRSRPILEEEDYSDEESREMAMLRRAESERRGSTPSFRVRPSSFYNTVEERGNFRDGLSHAQSIDTLNSSSNDPTKLTKLSFYRTEAPLNNSFVDNRGAQPQRSMSHRELRPLSSGSDHSIVDAFGFVSSGNGYGGGGGFHSTTNLYHKPAHNDHNRYRKPPEVPPPPANYHPSIPLRNESPRNYSQGRPMRQEQQNWKSSSHLVMNSSYNSGSQLHDKENYNKQRLWDSQRISSNGTAGNHGKDGGVGGPPPIMTSKASFGPVVRRAESMKRIMQKNRNTEQNVNSSPSCPVTSEVVSEKGRSVKSIVGMFDHQPAIHEALAQAKAKNSQNSLREEPEPIITSNAEVQFNGPTPQKLNRSDRNGTQVVHIAKFVQIETPTKPPAVHYSDAQTSPMQLSPAEVKQPSRTFSSAGSNEKDSSASSGPIIAKAETFSGGPRPKVATITSSTSSYLSNDVFTPQTDMDSPVFPTTPGVFPTTPGEGIDRPAFLRTDSHLAPSGGNTVGGRQFYLSSDSGVNAEGSGYPELAHNSNIPATGGGHNLQRYPSSPSTAYPSQTGPFGSRQDHPSLTDSERESNHYEDLESLRAGSVNDSENIYEPIGPLSARDPASVNYMNYTGISSPSDDYMDMNHPGSNGQSQVKMDTRSGYNSDSSPQRAMDRHFPANGMDYDDSPAEQDYSNQVREASHRTLRQTSIEGSKFKSPTREEQLNRYNLSKNVNPVQPQQQTRTPAVRPQVLNQYSSELNVTSPQSSFSIVNNEGVTVKMRNKTGRTDSCRIQTRSKHQSIDRTASYREIRNMEGQGPPGSKAQIRDSLINFCKRKSRDSLDSGLLENSLSPMSHTSSNSGTPTHMPGQISPNRTSGYQLPMHRIQSERFRGYHRLRANTFNTRNIPNPRDDQQQHHQRTGSTDRQLQAQNLSYPSTPVSGSAATMSASTTTENARPTFIGGPAVDSHNGSYMHSWEASNVVNNRNMSAGSGSSDNKSPTSPSPAAGTNNQGDSPRVRKPLVAEVSPFGMQNVKTRKDRQPRNDPSNSSAGANVLKPVKPNIHHTSPDTHEAAPILPPRNYHPEDTHNATELTQSTSEDVLSKPYQNVFHGSMKSGGPEGDNDFDAGYTERLRLLSKQQKYVHTTSPSEAKPLPSQQPSAATRPHSHHQQTSQQQLSPHNSSYSSPVLGGSGGAAQQYQPGAANVSPQQQGYHQASSPYQQQKNLHLQMTNHSASNLRQQQILETDIDGSGAAVTPEVQPTRPPRRHVAPPESPSSPPELPPKTFSSHEINHNEHKSPFTPTPHAITRQDALANQPYRPFNDRKSLGGIGEHNKQSPPVYRRAVTVNTESGKPSPPITRRHTERPADRVPPTQIEPVAVFESAREVDTDFLQTTTPVTMRPQPTERRERRAESMRSPVVTEDLSVISADASAQIKHLTRRTSFGKQSKRRSISNASTQSKEEKTPSTSNSDSSSGKPSPSGRLHQQRETEFSASEVSVLSGAELLDANSINNAIQDNKPKPFGRYNPSSYHSTSMLPPGSASHSRSVSAELLDIASRTESPGSRHPSQGSLGSLSGSRDGLAGSRDGLDSPANRYHSPLPAPRSPKQSTSGYRSERQSLGSLSGSRKSTPSPHSSSSDHHKGAKSDPSTPVEKSFVKISDEIMAGLADQGIDITEKSKCISDENKAAARLVKIEQLQPDSPPARKKAPSIRHIRQKSSDEILCDDRLEILNRGIKDETISQALSQPQKGTKDYLPGLFDDVLVRELPRKQRQSLDNSPCHSKQSSEADGLIDRHSTFDDELHTVQEKKDELVLVLKKKLDVLKQDQEFREQEISDNEVNGAKVVELVESKCSDREVKKYKSYIDDVEKITKLLLKLSRRLARAENELRNAPMDATDDDKKSLEQKRNNLQRQHDDAKALKESIDKRKSQVTTFLKRSLDDVDFKDFDNYINIKLQLIMEVSDIEDQVTHCEEQIAAIEAVSS